MIYANHIKFDMNYSYCKLLAISYNIILYRDMTLEKISKTILIFILAIINKIFVIVTFFLTFIVCQIMIVKFKILSCAIANELLSLTKKAV